MSPVAWIAPTVAALFLYGVGQVLVKKYISEVPPARYCLLFFFAKSIVNLGYFAYYYGTKPELSASAGLSALPASAFVMGSLAYCLEGVAWICYYESIARGPVSIVGTMSAAYAAPNVLFAYLFLGERLLVHQYAGVALVIVACVGLGYAPDEEEDGKKKGRAWIPLALTALALWGVWQTLVKHTYNTYKVNDAQMALFNVMGAFSTLGLYGIVRGRNLKTEPGVWKLAALPTAVMASGDLAVIIATQTGKVGVVTPISGAYPVVTLAVARIALKEKITRFQWVAVGVIVAGMLASMLGPPEQPETGAEAPTASITLGL
ncbi:MAG: DMT family transporter [Polyangiaceae bacterium]